MVVEMWFDVAFIWGFFFRICDITILLSIYRRICVIACVQIKPKLPFVSPCPRWRKADQNKVSAPKFGSKRGRPLPLQLLLNISFSALVVDNGRPLPLRLLLNISFSALLVDNARSVEYIVNLCWAYNEWFTSVLQSVVIVLVTCGCRVFFRPMSSFLQ